MGVYGIDLSKEKFDVSFLEAGKEKKRLYAITLRVYATF